LAPAEPLDTTLVRVDVQENNIVVLEARPRGADAAQAEKDTAQAHFFEIPSFPTMDTISPSDLQSILRANGRELRPEMADEAMNRRMEDKLRPDHEITLEYLRMQALKGVVKDGKGNTLVNLFTRFGISEKTVAFALGTGGTDVKAKCASVVSHIRKNLKGETMNGVSALCGPDWFEKLVNHASVKETWQAWEAASEARHPEREEIGGMWGRTFKFGNIFFREYDAEFPLQGGSSESAVAADTCHFFPTGTRNTFRTHFAPANDIRYVNTRAQELYVSIEHLKHGEGIELKAESCPLPLWKRPALLVRGTTN